MTSLRPFRPEDLLRLSLPNLDPLTENYDLGFYTQYLATWPSLFTVAEDVNGNIIGYSSPSLPLNRTPASFLPITRSFPFTPKLAPDR